MEDLGKYYSPDPRYLTLGEGFGDSVHAATFPKHILRWRNDKAAKTIGLDHLSNEKWINYFGKFHPLPNNLEQPQALRYHGHQFRHYNPDLGDGRGFLFAQMRDENDRLLDLGTKGSGVTPYSRDGDGRLTLKGGVREILATEMLEALGVNTSKSFSLIETGESLTRGDEPSPTRSSVLVRLSHSHLRIGTFQRLAYLSQHTLLEKLIDYSLETYFGIQPSQDSAQNACLLLEAVSKATAQLTASILAAGFVHGVLNTDNINITGENFDYGPWRFLPTLDPGFTAAYFDRTGLYAYGRQPQAIHWDLYQLGGAFSDIAPHEDIKGILDDWQTHLTPFMRQAYLKRLGLQAKNDKEDDEFLNEFLGWMVASEAPFDQVFFDWHGGGISEQRASDSPLCALYSEDAFSSIKQGLNNYSPHKKTALDTPYFSQKDACSMLIDEVESLWSHIDERDDWGPFEKKIKAIRSMGEALK
ncbi:YdiU family protein [Temperatibacter marinus]|uniref:YdiU family protein n=1 Tax=Temperatibacter marinus TaxID=1456591 RepID=A0AA52H8G3_9PROT|nr:YdiU family protein [Temperatibacter marinus]WND01417.1 YdiU family protein [Temperatibacter marinus]